MIPAGTQVIYTPDWGPERNAIVLEQAGDDQDEYLIELTTRLDGTRSYLQGHRIHAPERCLTATEEATP